MSRYFFFLIAALAVAGFFDSFATQFRYTMTTYVREDFAVEFGELAGLMSWVYLASLLSFIPRVLADVVGRKPMLAITLVGLCLFQWSLSFARTPQEYAALLALLAIFYKSDIWLIVISEEAPARTRAFWSTLTAALAGLGAVSLGGLVRTLSEDPGDWRRVSAYPLYGLLVAIPLVAFVRETAPFTALRSRERSSFRPRLLIAPFRRGVAGNLLLLTLLKCFFVGGAFAGIALLGSEYLRTGNGLSTESVGRIVQLDVLSSMIGLALSGFVADRFGRRRSFFAFAILYAASLMGLALLPRGSSEIVACYIAQSYFATSIFGILRVVTVEVLPNDCRATGSAWSDLATTVFAAQTAQWIRGLTLGSFALLGAVDLGTIILGIALAVPVFAGACLFLRETRGISLDEIEPPATASETARASSPPDAAPQARRAISSSQ